MTLASVEFPNPLVPRPDLSHVLFDFDGTLSLIRQGWPEVMVPMFAEALPRRAGESEADLRADALDDIMRLNGKQTIYQMIQLADRVRERGGRRKNRWNTSTNTSAGSTPTPPPAPPRSVPARPRPMTSSSSAPAPCSTTSKISAFTSTWRAAPTRLL